MNLVFKYLPPLHPPVGLLRGLVAEQATSKSERMVTVPAKAAITLKASESTPLESWVSSDFWDRCVYVFHIIALPALVKLVF